MTKRIIQLICLIAFCMALFCPLGVSAVTPLDPDAEASLTLNYTKEEQVFPDLEISIYRVAEAFPDGTFELIEPFASYPINIHDIKVQEQWKNTAVTLSAYIVANQVAPYREETTDESGTVCFENLETGLYLVDEVIVENNSGTYLFDKFMVYLPTVQSDGTFDYTVEANPKCVSYVPKTEYRVMKLWKDEGHQNDRPREISVEIYRNGELKETQVLSTANNWSYTWYVSDDDKGEWTVVERSASDDYVVTIQKNGQCFSIINTHRSFTEPGDGPQTGDTVSLTLYIMIMCLLGIILVISSLYGRRKRRA